MIFNNYLTEQQIVENLIKESEFENGIILKAYYNEETDSLFVDELPYLLTEDAAGIQAKKLYISNDKNDNSHILFGGSSNGGHGPRIKVSKSSTGNDKGSFSLKYDNNKLEVVGDYKKAGFKKKEFEKIVDYAKRNKNLIVLSQKSDLGDIHNAAIKDAKLYHDGIDYERTEDGNLIIYGKDKKGDRVVKSIENLKGKKIE